MGLYDLDFFVIGGGSGGVRAARIAAEHGARVAIAEESRWGGTCVVRGCVPKKLMVYASEISRTLDDARGQGWTIPEARFDWATFIAAKDKEIARLSAGYLSRLQKAGVAIHDARAKLLDAHTIEVGGTRLTAANILIATGGRPKWPDASCGPGTWVTSDEVFHLAELPKKIAILGAGYIGIEFAHIFAGFGSKVTIVHRHQHVLHGFDPEIAAQVEHGLAKHGIDLHIGDHLPDEPFDLRMAAIGRHPASDGMGLAEAGVVMTDRGAVVVDEWSRTNVPHIYAVGDVTSRVQLTPIAIREGHAVADTLFGKRPTSVTHELIPTAVFAQPSVAMIGCTEPAAIAAGHDIHVYRARFKPMRYALSGRDEQVLIKLVVSKTTDKVLGLHIVGPDAPEIVQAAAIAITMGATKADLDRTFALHPTTAEELVLLR
jgi:glutathione reductase (NADPH)